MQANSQAIYPPPTTRTEPSSRRVAVWSMRPSAMVASSRVHSLVAGSYSSAESSWISLDEL